MQARLHLSVSAAISLLIAAGAPFAHGEEATTQKDHLSFIEHAETHKVAADVAKRIVNTVGTAVAEIPATKEDELLACSVAHNGSASTGDAEDAHYLKFVTMNPQDDPQVSRIAQGIESKTDKSFSVAAWPLRGLSQKGTFVILVRLHSGSHEELKMSIVNAACR